VLHHHERWDGGGYPNGLAGEEIPTGSRILFVADAYEAMTADRVYRPAIGHDAACGELKRCAGTQFDEAVVSAFLAALKREGAIASRSDAR
jgi:HD-GYP domain-containing protein (c-di-GMP phosphodiesterase class II)